MKRWTPAVLFTALALTLTSCAGSPSPTPSLTP